MLGVFISALAFTANCSLAQTSLSNHATAENNSIANLTYPALITKFYELKQNKIVWFQQGENAHQLRQVLQSKIESSVNIGLTKERFHPQQIDNNVDNNLLEKDSTIAIQTDEIFTDAAIAYCKDVYQGQDIKQWAMYDEISSKYKDDDNLFLLNKLAGINSADDLLLFFNSLEPTSKEYSTLKNELQVKADSLTSLQKKQLITSINLYRWMHHFKFEKWIVVNIASATLRYYEFDSLKLNMKVVVGKPSTKTPRFAAHCNQVILYPYWNVPSSIALNELLPMFKRNPSNVDNLNMQIIDAKGNIVNHHKLNWKSYSRAYFPFRVRQSTGCDNSLGVIKFNLTSPYSVYLHDTNYKGAFTLSSRYLSHGCIRLEKLMELANYLLPQKINNEFLESCLKDQQPVALDLASLVPVFVIYQNAEVDVAGKISYFKDVYDLLQ